MLFMNFCLCEQELKTTFKDSKKDLRKTGQKGRINALKSENFIMVHLP